MFEIKVNATDEVVLTGRFDASKVAEAKAVFNDITSSRIVNFADLEYISSAGLSTLLVTQKRLSGAGEKLKLVGMSEHIKEIFRYAGFDTIFEIE